MSPPVIRNLSWSHLLVGRRQIACKIGDAEVQILRRQNDVTVRLIASHAVIMVGAQSRALKDTRRGIISGQDSDEEDTRDKTCQEMCQERHVDGKVWCSWRRQSVEATTTPVQGNHGCFYTKKHPFLAGILFRTAV